MSETTTKTKKPAKFKLSWQDMEGMEDKTIIRRTSNGQHYMLYLKDEEADRTDSYTLRLEDGSEMRLPKLGIVPLSEVGKAVSIPRQLTVEEVFGLVGESAYSAKAQVFREDAAAMARRPWFTEIDQEDIKQKMGAAHAASRVEKVQQAAERAVNLLRMEKAQALRTAAPELLKTLQEAYDGMQAIFEKMPPEVYETYGVSELVTVQANIKAAIDAAQVIRYPRRVLTVVVNDRPHETPNWTGTIMGCVVEGHAVLDDGQAFPCDALKGEIVVPWEKANYLGIILHPVPQEQAAE